MRYGLQDSRVFVSWGVPKAADEGTRVLCIQITELGTVDFPANDLEGKNGQIWPFLTLKEILEAERRRGGRRR
jgi:hypothetical protein